MVISYTCGLKTPTIKGMHDWLNYWPPFRKAKLSWWCKVVFDMAAWSVAHGKAPARGDVFTECQARPYT